MPWVPTTDFEEEILNLQPDHDFIFGALSETHHPRPTYVVNYAEAKKLEDKNQQKAFEANGKINAKLRVIQEVQRITNSKPLGEQASLDDWDNNERREQDTIGLIRHFGMGPYLDYPLNENVTIATYPVENTNKVVKNGRRKVALFFDDNVFKLKEKVSDVSSGFESCNSSSNKIVINQNDSLASEGDTSLSTSSSFSFNTAEECYDNSVSPSDSRFKLPLKKICKKPLNQYEKLIEDTSLLSLNNSRTSSSSKNTESFRSADESFSWTPVFEDDDVFSKTDNWPVLSKNKKICDINSTENNDTFNTTQSDLTDDTSSEISSTKTKKGNFLDRFIKSDENDKVLDNTFDSTSATSTKEPNTYASITKTINTTKKKEKKSPDFITHFPPFYTTRKMYALKRGGK